MSLDLQRCKDLIHRYHLGNLEGHELAELEEALKSSQTVRTIYRQLCRLDTMLRREAGELDEGRPIEKVSVRVPGIAIAAGLVALVVACFVGFSGREAARLSSTKDAVWSKQSFSDGDLLKKGTKLHLESGEAQIRFNSGAMTTLSGEAIFKVKSANSGYLSLGLAESVVSSPKASGFTLAMPVASVVDKGTAFETLVNQDRSSLVNVTDGQVDVKIGRKRLPLSAGMGISIQAGDPTIILRIEKGNDSSDFKFRSMASPSSRDYADASRGNARIIVRGRLGLVGKEDPDSKILNDGRGQSASNRPSDSFYFKKDEFGAIIFDLGKKVPVSKINTYTWHKNPKSGDTRRAFQHYKLWAFPGDELPDISDTPEIDGWIPIAEVHSDQFFGIKNSSERPPQLGCRLEGVAGIIGNYRYLYFDIKASNFQEKGGSRIANLFDHSMYGEIDIYVDED